MSLVDTINSGLLLLTCLAAVWKGGPPERIGGVLYLLSWLPSVAVWASLGLMKGTVPVLPLDTAVLIAFGYMSWKSGRAWLMWAAAFQSIDVSIHFATLLDLRVSHAAYFWSLCLSAYGVIGSIAVGTFNAWREREALAGSTGAF
jgi:hypothetical protein